MRLFVLLLVVAMFAGCGSSPGPAVERLYNHKETYQACLQRNNGDDGKCVTEKKVYEAELKYYNAGSSGDSGAAARTPTVCSKFGNTTVCN